MKRMKKWVVVMTPVIMAAFLAGCSVSTTEPPILGDKENYMEKAPNFSSEQALPNLVNLMGTIDFGNVTQMIGTFPKLENAQQFAGYMFRAPAGANITIEVNEYFGVAQNALTEEGVPDATVDPWIAIYGPKKADGLFGAYIAINDDASLNTYASRVSKSLDSDGDYLIIIRAHFGKSGWKFGLDLGCAGNCTKPKPECPDVLCALYCANGFARDEKGCDTCECATECATDADCGEGFYCALMKCGGMPVDAATNERSEDGEKCAGGGGVCMPKEQGCMSDADCPEGFYCAIYRCGPEPAAGGSEGEDSTVPPERCMDGGGVCTPKNDCFCTEEYNPVCGVDGQTYGNPCFAKCAGVEIAFPGECGEPRECEADRDCPPDFHCEMVYCADDASASGSEPGSGDDTRPGYCGSGVCVPNQACFIDCVEGYRPDFERCICVPEECPPVECPPECEIVWPEVDCRPDASGSGQECVGAVCPVCACREGCLSDFDCAAGEHCEFNRDDCVYTDPAAGSNGEPADPVPCDDPSSQGCVPPDPRCHEYGKCVPNNICGGHEGIPCPPGMECLLPPVDCGPDMDCITYGQCVPGGECGGIAGLICPEGYECLIEENYPDAMGRCVPAPKCKVGCQTDEDCALAAGPGPMNCLPDPSGDGQENCVGPALRCVYADRAADHGICQFDCVPGPFCGSDGVTYVNLCDVPWCLGVYPVANGLCRNDCECPMVWLPVCGMDGRTYGNACEARCAFMEVAFEGECEERPGDCGNGRPCPDGMFCNFCPPDPNCPMCDVCGPARCEEERPPEVCNSDEDCPAGMKCESECTSFCEEDPNGSGSFCGGSCTPPKCVPVEPPSECIATGCSGEICAPEPMASACVWLPEFECLHFTRCGLQADGACGWAQTPEYLDCLDRIRNGCDSGRACAEGEVCIDGACRPGGCVCPAVVRPVCGDGVTYNNYCEAVCAGAREIVEGSCDEGCVCPMIYAPVCGADGRTYGNMCELNCARVELRHEGACERGTEPATP